MYNITASFKIPEELKYTIQYYISHHMLNRLKIVNNYYNLNEELCSGTMVWENIKELHVAEIEGCLKELAEVFLLKDLKFNEQAIKPVQETTTKSD